MPLQTNNITQMHVYKLHQHIMIVYCKWISLINAKRTDLDEIQVVLFFIDIHFEAFGIS